MVRPPPPDYLRQQSDWSSATGTSAKGMLGIPYNNGHGLQQLNSRETFANPRETQERAHATGHVLPSHRQPTTRRQQQQQMNGNSNPPINTPTKRNLTRAKTLTRPDRHVTPAPLLSAPSSKQGLNHSPWWQPWSFYISSITIWAPGWLLSACGMRQQTQQRAWKEKVALCSIALFMGAFVGFVTIGLNRALCPSDQGSTPNEFIRLGEQAGESG